MGFWYCTLEDVKNALDSGGTSRTNVQIDRAIEAASREIERMTRRKFYPWTGTRYIRWPSSSRQFGGNASEPWRLWLGQNELVSVSALLSAGVALAPGAYYLEPSASGPPYTSIEINLAGVGSFNAGPSQQRSIAITGVFGFTADERTGGATASTMDATQTTVNVTDSGTLGIGHTIRVDTERMQILGKSMLATGQTLGSNLGSSNAAGTVAVASGAAFAVNEVILIDAEKMLITDISGNNLIVRRAWDASALAAHTSGAAISAARTLRVSRAVLGTVAGTHASAAPVAVALPPGSIRALAVAEALNTVAQEGSAYVRTIGSGDTERNASGGGLDDLRERVRCTYGLRALTRAV